jgi:hypothetical protein
MDAGNARFGPHTAEVETLLVWIDSRELIRFGKSLSGPYIPVADFDEARAIATDSQTNPDGTDWTELRENAESALHDAGQLDTPTWLPYKSAIQDDLLNLVADRVDATLPEKYRALLDDVIADLNSCAICLALHGRLNPFHERLWQAYSCGGWPCGCTGEPPDDELHLDDRQFYVFWHQAD